ncbi:phosphotransferase [soil metagenome]
MTIATLDHAGIAARIPHAGSMCLLDSLQEWSATEVHCVATGHADSNNPLRTRSGLLAPAAIEYAAQAMALHGALVCASPDGPAPGYLASVRKVRMLAARLDDIDGALHVRAERLAGDAKLVSYNFAVSDARGKVLVDGRATVVLNDPLPGATA